MNTRNDMPQCQCPECDNEWQKDDHYLIETDDTIFCPSCGAELLVERIEIQMTVTLSSIDCYEITE